MLKQGRSQRWGRGGNRPPPTSPPRGTLAPPRTFTRLITEGQLEHYGIILKERLMESTKESTRNIKNSDKFINIYAKNVKFFPSFLFLIKSLFIILGYQQFTLFVSFFSKFSLFLSKL